MNSSTGATQPEGDGLQQAGSAQPSGLKETLKRSGRERAESGKRLAAEQIENIADALDAAGSHLDHSQPTLAGYATHLAGAVDRVAKRLREGSIEDLGRDARQLAARNPTLFLLGAVALGTAVAHFLKASSESARVVGSDGNGEWKPDNESPLQTMGG